MQANEDKSMIRKRMHNRGICVIIPTYNNDATLRKVIEDACEYCDDIIVVNDGSTDNTNNILNNIEQIVVVNHEKNQGKGHALRSGFRKAIELGFAYAITMDSDGQHYAHDIPSFLAANCDYPGALIVGSRRLDGVERSAGSAFANKFSNFWFFVQTGRHLSDTQTGFRLYPLLHLYGLNILTSRYEAELELMVLASWHGVKLVEIPVDVYYPPRDKRISHFRPGMDFGRISLLNSVLCFFAVVYAFPLWLLRKLYSFLCTTFGLLFFLTFVFGTFTPLMWIYFKIGKVTETKRLNLHKLMYHAARFVTVHMGIPRVKISYNVDKNVEFDKPSVIISNHQSHLDLACLLMFTPKVVCMANDWAWHNPFYGFLIRHAEYLPSSMGMEELMPRLKNLVGRGYSIIIFPEGTRSHNCHINRFHQGAFYIADKLNLDVIPILLYGAGKVLPKGGRHLNKGQIHIEVNAPVSNEELSSMGGYRQQASSMHKRYLNKYEQISDKLEQHA